RPQPADRCDVPDRHPRHQHGPDRAGQHRPDLPRPSGHVRAARDAAVQHRAGRPAVPQRPADRTDRHVRGEGRRRAAGRGRRRGRAATAAADPAAAATVQRALAPGRTPARPLVLGARRDPAGRLLRGGAMTNYLGNGVRQSGNFFAFCLDALRGMAHRPLQWREFAQQAWFISSVSILPAALVSIPFGAVISLQLGSLVRQLGAQSFTGAAAVLAVVREAGPIVTALIIAGAGGSAICADLGSRKIREELDAMAVLGIDAVERLVTPRLFASMLVAVLLNGLVNVVGVAGGYVFNVVLQGGTPGAYLASFQALGQLPDLLVGEFKALVFGAAAALVASYKGITAKGGPKGVGDAVNQSVVLTFMLLFVLNFVITAVYFQVVPQKGT